MNGIAVVNDSAYPFELSAALHSIAANGSNTVTLAVRATDTAGHVATTAPVAVTLTPKRGRTSSREPVAGGELGPQRRISQLQLPVFQADRPADADQIGRAHV